MNDNVVPVYMLICILIVLLLIELIGTNSYYAVIS